MQVRLCNTLNDITNHQSLDQQSHDALLVMSDEVGENQHNV